MYRVLYELNFIAYAFAILTHPGSLSSSLPSLRMCDRSCLIVLTAICVINIITTVVIIVFCPLSLSSDALRN